MIARDLRDRYVRRLMTHTTRGNFDLRGALAAVVVLQELLVAAIFCGP